MLFFLWRGGSHIKHNNMTCHHCVSSGFYLWLASGYVHFTIERHCIWGDVMKIHSVIFDPWLLIILKCKPSPDDTCLKQCEVSLFSSSYAAQFAEWGLDRWHHCVPHFTTANSRQHRWCTTRIWSCTLKWLIWLLKLVFKMWNAE